MRTHPVQIQGKHSHYLVQLKTALASGELAPGEPRSASEAAQPQPAVYKLHIGPRSYRLRPPADEQPHSIFTSLPEVEGPLAYLLWLSATELPLEFVYLLPATKANRSRVVLQPTIERCLPPLDEVRLEREDTHTGESQSLEIRAKRYTINTEETSSVGSIRLGLRHV